MGTRNWEQVALTPAPTGRGDPLPRGRLGVSPSTRLRMIPSILPGRTQDDRD